MNTSAQHTINLANNHPSRSRNSSLKKSITTDNQSNFFKPDYNHQDINSMTNSTNYTLKDVVGATRTINRVDYNKYLQGDYRPPAMPMNNYKESSQSKSKNTHEIPDINPKSSENCF